MPHFHETGYGRQFFSADLPRIVKALDRIAVALTQLAASNPTDAASCPHCGAGPADADGELPHYRNCQDA